MIVESNFLVYSKKGRALKAPVVMNFEDGRIEFLKSPFALKDEIKAMKDARWHGYIEGDNRKIWSVKDCQRNRFQIGYLEGKDVYGWFDREVVKHEYDRPLMAHQKEMADAALTYHFQIWAAEMGVGKTLAAIEVIEKSGVACWWYVAPKKVLVAIEREFKKWKLDPAIQVELMTYEAFTRRVDEWQKDEPLPQGVIFDESSKLKSSDSQRTQAALFITEKMRERYNHDCFVVLMTGTPSPKSPVDWWSQCEIAYPGFLREGSERAFKMRLGFVEKKDFGEGAYFNDLLGWKDDENKCNVCGRYRDENELHDADNIEEDGYHPYEKSINEVAYLYERLQGLVIFKYKRDCVDLPDKQYRVIKCQPNPSTLRVAQALMDSAPNTITGLTWLRELSDGFQYREEVDGKTTCKACNENGQIAEWVDPEDEDRTYSQIDFLRPEQAERLEQRFVECPHCGGSREVDKIVRIAREVPCPKEAALKDLLAENEEQGRIVVFAGFTGSVDRCVNICLREGWDVVRCDGRGFQVFVRESDGEVKSPRVDALDYWADRNNSNVAFVAHPESGGMGLTLTEASMAVFWSNSFKPEYRTQSEDRIHRTGMDENRGAIIVDLIHLPTDQRVLDVIRENRKLELMTMGDFEEALKNAEVD